MMSTSLLYDDDCGVCTIFAKGLNRLFSIHTMPMHQQSILKKGIKAIGEDEYWRSFHIVNGNKWTTEQDAIVELFKIVPLGSIPHRVIKLAPIMKYTMFVLKYLQNTRKLECEIN